LELAALWVVKRQALLQFLYRGQGFVRIANVLDFVRGLDTNLPLTVLTLLTTITTLPRLITTYLVLITLFTKGSYNFTRASYKKFGVRCNFPVAHYIKVGAYYSFLVVAGEF
jgi:hypothetical protein